METKMQGRLVPVSVSCGIVAPRLISIDEEARDHRRHSRRLDEVQ